MIVFGDHVAKFVSDKLGFGLCPPFVGLGLERNGQIVAGVILNHFEGSDVHVTIAGSGWTRGFIDAVGRYVFGSLGCERMTAVTSCDDVVSFAKRLGGEAEGTLRSHFGRGQNATVIGILSDDWPYARDGTPKRG